MSIEFSIPESGVSPTSNPIQVVIPRLMWHSLTYTCSAPLPPGTVLKVPIRSEWVWGVVLRQSTTKDMALISTHVVREIDPLHIHPVVQLSRTFLLFLHRVATYYHYAFGLVVRMGCPTRILNSKVPHPSRAPGAAPQSLHALTPLQEQVFHNIQVQLTEGKNKHLIWGQTGSGKTEIYMHLAKSQLEQGKKVLIVVPEIALTPQLVRRFSDRLGGSIVTLHSDLASATYVQEWYRAYHSDPCLVIGTRSALFHPLPQLGMLIMDEEHDRSYKQQDHMRYHAREVAGVRYHTENIPWILGSATPSYEMLHVCDTQNMQLHSLPKRHNDLPVPSITSIATPMGANKGHIAPVLKQAISETLSKGQQSLLFLNRKGFAPYLVCQTCSSWVACSNCDTTVTYYQKRPRCECHICGAKVHIPTACPTCASPFVVARGAGTEAIEAEVRMHFPDAAIARIDRDAVTTHAQLSHLLVEAEAGRIDILIGTQMLAKGHDFPKLTLVGILNGDQLMHFPDFRSIEWTMQMIHQVAGRAGRAMPGKVFVQTRHTHQDRMITLLQSDYLSVYRQEMAKRKMHQLTPFGYMARFVFEAPDASKGQLWLAPLTQHIQSLQSQLGLRILPPSPCLITKMAKRYRFHVLVTAQSAQILHHAIRHILVWCHTSYPNRRYRLDIQPEEFL